MRTVLIRLAVLLSLSQFARPGPILPVSLASANNTFLLQERSCTTDYTPCGYYGQACCAWNEVCYTDPSNDQASCSATAAPTAAVTPAPSAGSWVYWTSTFVSTGAITYYSTYSSYVPVPAATTPAGPQTTNGPVNCPDADQTPCGPICCAGWQFCQVQGQCAPRSSSWIQSAYTTPTTSYNSYTAPLRPTSVGTSTVYKTSTPTTTVGFMPAVETGSNVTITSTTNSGGLSGGAIAGIVIGVILGLIILILICLCICAGELLSGILAFFGIGRDKRHEPRRTTEEVEYYNRHGSRADGRSWYGSGRRPPKKQKEKGIGWLTLIAGGLAAFWAALTFGRRRRDEKSDYSYSSYDSRSYTASSARRTEDSRRGPSRR